MDVLPLVERVPPDLDRLVEVVERAAEVASADVDLGPIHERGHGSRQQLGIANDIGGEAHPIVGPLADEGHDHDDDDAEVFGERDFENFAFNGRATAQFEVSPPKPGR